jgi:aspartyl-tRNA(Asn)/glutamyl-tRNA(Gln) amidotransferase subunit A
MKMSEVLAKKTISELAPLLQRREISPVEVTQSVLDRTKKLNDSINAYIDINNEKQVLQSAKLAEKEILEGSYRGALHGIPLALKDILNFKGEKVTMGSKIHQNFIPDFDATVVTKLKQAGALFTGKLNMHEYAYGGTTNNPHFGPCRNPWDLDRIPGGSSGGSGAAVASDMTIASLGTDTAGSIRIPASICGIVGLKPTHGLVSKYGCFPLSWSLDHIGPMTKTVEDAAILLECITGYDQNDATSVKSSPFNYNEALTGDIKGKVIGIEEDFFFNMIDHEVDSLVKDGIRKLEELGARIELVKIPSLKYSEFAEYMTFMAESALIHRNNLIERPQDFGEDVRASLLLANIPSANDYLQAQQIRRKISKEFSMVFEQIDVLIAPTLPVTASVIGEESVVINGQDCSLTDTLIRLTSPANLTGIPSISIPAGLSQGLPVGMQIMGPAFSEEVILNFAFAFEQTNPLKGLKPEIGQLVK